MMNIGENKEMLQRIAGMAKALRCCQQEAAFCENLTFSQFYILDTIGEYRKLQISRLNEILSVDKSTTTRLVKPLVTRQLVIREKSTSDGRVIRLKLTLEGEEVRRQVWSCVTEYFNKIESSIPDEKRSSIYKAVQLFSDALVNAGPGCCSPGIVDKKKDTYE